MSSPLVDVHAHFLPEFYREALREAGHLPGPSGFHKIPEWSAEDHLAFMERNNIRKTYLSISTPGTFITPPVAGDGGAALRAAKDLTRKTNEFGSRVKRDHPSKFGFFASLPLPDIQASLEEIDYIESHLPFDGFMFLSNAFGTYLGDPSMVPIYERLNAMHATVFVHPATPCTTGQTPAAVEATQAASLTPQKALYSSMPLADSYAAPMIEFLFDTTRSFCDLLLTQTATTYPDITWIIPHCGSVLPSVLDRVIRFSQVLPKKESSQRVMAPLSTDAVKEIIAKQFYFDLAGLPMGSQIHHILRWADHTRLLYGSDVPFTPWELGSTLAEEIREELPRIFGVETGVHECMRICHGNAEQLFQSSSGV